MWTRERSAARGLTGKTLTIAKARQAPLELSDGTTLVVTVHPSALLRIEDEADKRAAYADFVADLRALQRGLRRVTRHCEEQSDVAIQTERLDCFAIAGNDD